MIKLNRITAKGRFTMKKITKAVLGTAAAATTGYCLLADLIDKLLVDRRYTVPQEFSDKVSGADISSLAELCAINMEWLEGYGYEKYSITSDRGVRLVGYLMKAEKPSDIYVLGCHGYRSDGKKEFNAFAQYYLKKGINVFLIDHVAAGESEGKYIGFDRFEYADALKWLTFMTETFGKDIRIIVHGVSMGAATVMMMSGAGNLSRNVKFIVSDCGYTSAWDEFEYKLKEMKVPTQPLLNTVNAINKHRAGYDFKDTSALESVKKASVPMLFVHGGADVFVPTYMAYILYDACASKDKDLLIVDGADHAQSFIDGQAQYEAKLDEFIEKFIVSEKEKATV